MNKCILLLILFFSGVVHAQQPQHSFALGDSAFLLDGKPFQIISGEMHYPRVPREAWRQRMKMAKAMGLNTIGTYIFWNLHEPQKGQYNFSGNNDIAAFVKTAQEEGLWVVLRPSPYVCAEWEFGGYPYWLQNEQGLEVRSKEPKYIAAYKNYIMAVGKQLAPLQVQKGGNILIVQIENEYGSYGSDKEYLNINRKLFIEAGFDGLLYTCDPANDVVKGHLPPLLPAVNGLDKPEKVKSLINANHNGKGPYMIAEWYPAWFDWWGTKHHTVDPDKYAASLDTVLAAGISINMYMFHGGSTRSFMNGANYNDRNPYEPQISSYDYDAPLDEAGNATPKFMKFREAIIKNLPPGVMLPPVPRAKNKIAVAPVSLNKAASIFDRLPSPKKSLTPLTFEDLHQAYGFVLYRTVLPNGVAGLLKLTELRDYALVFINGKKVGVLDRRIKKDSLLLEATKGRVTLDILVENLGRVNFGAYLLKNKKGITDKVTINGKPVLNWQLFSLPFDKAPELKATATKLIPGVPVLREGSFTVSETGDTYLDMSNWGKGVVWVNGHNLGRYWSIGPQQTLYVPVEWLKKGANKVTVLELLKPEQEVLITTKTAILDVLNMQAATK